MLAVESKTGLPAGLRKLRLAAACQARFRHLSLELQRTRAFLGIRVQQEITSSTASRRNVAPSGNLGGRPPFLGIAVQMVKPF